MTWLQLQIETTPAELGSLEDLMLAAGAVAVTLEDNADEPVLEPAPGETPLWGDTRLTGLYPADTDMDAILASFPEHMTQGRQFRIEILEDKDWEREWIKHYQPMRFGKRLWICPSWLEPPEPEAINLLLDPGLAFGTGTHPTTALCLTELDSLDFSYKRVVDYGCGSGILALAALKLGAVSVLGIDNDPQALSASRDNTARNGIPAERLIVAMPGQEPLPSWVGKADLVVANILAGPLMDLSSILLELLRQDGTLILSGLLNTQAKELQAHYSQNIALEICGEKENWVCLRGTLKVNPAK
jgi:ribosomal protein L11 methyltransferase